MEEFLKGLHEFNTRSSGLYQGTLRRKAVGLGEQRKCIGKTVEANFNFPAKLETAV